MSLYRRQFVQLLPTGVTVDDARGVEAGAVVVPSNGP